MKQMMKPDMTIESFCKHIYDFCNKYNLECEIKKHDDRQKSIVIVIKCNDSCKVEWITYRYNDLMDNYTDIFNYIVDCCHDYIGRD